jgi:hypothetical protein
MILALMPRLIKDVVGFMRGQPLVAQVNRQPRQLTKFRGEGLSFFGLGASLTRHMQRVADHNRAYSIAPGEARQGTEIVAAVSFSLKGHHWMRGYAQLVRNGYADATVANVESEIAGLGLA